MLRSGSSKLFRWCRIGFRGAATSSAQTLRHSAPASNIFPMALRCSALASNKPHPAEKRTPVWLAIWRIWAGFANSQLLPDAAALSSMQGLPWSGNSSAQTSASLHPPAALRLRCLPFTRDMGVHGLCGRVPDSAGSICPPDEAAAWPGTQVLDGKCCCWLFVAQFLQITAHASKMQMPHNQRINFHSCARWHQFELTEHGAKS